MEIRGERDALVEAGQAVLRVVSPRATLPVLAGVRITAGNEGVEFAATDLEVFIAVKSDLVVESAGVAVVPGRLFGEILRSLPPGQVTIRAQSSEVVIEAPRVEFSLSALPAGEFPEVGKIGEASVNRLTATDLHQALRRVVRAASADEARPVLTGVLWSLDGGMLRLVSTDSYRLAIREIVPKEAGTGREAILPGRALAEFGRHLGGLGDGAAEIAVGESQAALEVGPVRLVTRLIEGEFPNYRQLVPAGYRSRLVAGREALLEAVGRVGVVAQPNTPLRLHLGDEVRLTVTEPGIGEAHEVVEGAAYEGEPMVIAFSPRFLSDGLEGVEEERAVLETADPSKPAIVKGESREDFIYLVMPVRLGR